jgi:ATP-dependent Clp protease ATP-binding subunit ClpB
MRFDDYTATARQVVREANEDARESGHAQLGAGHVLRELLETSESHASQILSSLGTQTSTLRQAVSDELNGLPTVEGDHRVVIDGRLLRVFDQARSNARASSVPVTSTGHLLLALANVSGTLAHRALNAAEVTPERVQKAIRRVSNPERASRTDDTALHEEEATGSALERFAIDLTERARSGALDPVVGRDDEIRRVMEVLGRRRKNNPILVGEPGVGKTAIVEGLAHRLAEGDVPDLLRGKRLLALDLGSVIAGAKLRGDFEERLKQILNEVIEAAGQILLFIDEIHSLVGAGGGSSGGVDAASMLKPALARGELHCLGATTPREYSQHIERDAALARRFQTVNVEEPEHPEALSILRGLKGRYEAHHGVAITDSALSAAVRLSTRYVSDRFLPDKALDLVDEAASRLRLEMDALPAEIDEARRRQRQLEIEGAGLAREGTPAAQDQRDAIEVEIGLLETRLDTQLAAWKIERDTITRIRQAKEDIAQWVEREHESSRAGDLERAAEFRFGKIPQARRDLAALEGELVVLHKDGGWLRESVGAEDIARVVAAWTGIPVTRLGEDEAAKLVELEERLGEHVIGQPEAVTAVANVIRRARSGIQDPNRPLGSFLFLGPTGVGKTHLVRSVARMLFDDESAMIRLDMSEYGEKHSTARLVGAPPGYVGHEEGGQLTEAVRRRPYSVVLFDEVEKAHPEVFDLLLQLLDDGRLTDSMGRTVSFKNTIVVMTSNLGSEAILEEDADDESIAISVEAALGEFFRPEMLNRIDERVVFRRLDETAIRAIVELELNALAARLEARGLSLATDESAMKLLAREGFDPAFGARPVKRALRRLMEDPLALALLEGRFNEASMIKVSRDSQSDRLTFEAGPRDEEAA